MTSSTTSSTTARPPLSLVTAPAPDDDAYTSLPLTVPVPRAGSTPWPSEGGTTWVPAALLLAAAGQCSCDDCCAELARTKARTQLASV